MNELAAGIVYFYQLPVIDEAAAAKHISPEILPVIHALADALAMVEWTATAIHELIQKSVTDHALKFPKLAMPLRVMLTGAGQSPAIDAVMELLGRDEVIRRIRAF